MSGSCSHIHFFKLVFLLCSDVNQLEESAGPLITMAVLARSKNIVLTQVSPREWVRVLPKSVAHGRQSCSMAFVNFFAFNSCCCISLLHDLPGHC